MAYDHGPEFIDGENLAEPGCPFLAKEHRTWHA